MLFYEKIDILLLDKEISLKQLNQNIHMNSFRMKLLRHNFITPSRKDISKLASYSGYSTEFWLSQSKEAKSYKIRNYIVTGTIFLAVLLLIYLFVGLFAFEDKPKADNNDLYNILGKDSIVEYEDYRLTFDSSHAEVVGITSDASEYVIPEYFIYKHERKTYSLPITSVHLKEFGDKVVYLSSLVSDISFDGNSYWYKRYKDVQEDLRSLPKDIFIDANNPYYTIENCSILDLRDGYTVFTLKGCDYSKLENIKSAALYNIEADVLDLSSVKNVYDYGIAACKVNTIKFSRNLNVLWTTAITHSTVHSVIIPVTVETIADDAFYSYNTIDTIYYGGTEEQFYAALYGGKYFNFNGNLYFYSEEQPVDSNKKWHYDYNGNPVLW